MKKEFYTCKNDRAFKEVFLNPNNSDLLKALLEFILKIKIDKLEIKKTELLSGNVNVKDKRVDAIVHTGNKKIEIEINSQYEKYLNPRNTAYICNTYQSHTLVGKEYNQQTDIVQVNLTWGLGAEEDIMTKYMIMFDLDKKKLENMPKDDIVDKYITNVTIVNDNPEFQKYMSEEEDKKKIQNSLLSEAKETGYTSGINDGISKEKVSIAKNMLNKNISIEDISDITGLSIEEIENIKNNMKK